MFDNYIMPPMKLCTKLSHFSIVQVCWVLGSEQGYLYTRIHTQNTNIHCYYTHTCTHSVHTACMCVYHADVCMHAYTHNNAYYCFYVISHHSAADCMWCLHNWTLPYHHNCCFHRPGMKKIA